MLTVRPRTTNLVDGVECAFVGLELCLKRLVFLELGQQVGEISVRLVCRRLVLLLDPVGQLEHTDTMTIRGRNNSKISGTQLDYLVGKSGSPQIYVVVMCPHLNKIT